MRILLDECVDERLRHSFGEHDCETVRHAGLSGVENGDLLTAAEKMGFEVLVTVDQHIPDQQSMRGRYISLLILCGPTNRYSNLKPLIPSALQALRSIKRSEIVVIR